MPMDPSAGIGGSGIVMWGAVQSMTRYFLCSCGYLSINLLTPMNFQASS